MALHLAASAVWLLSSGCSFLAPPPKNVTLEGRLADFPTVGLPLRAPAEILFDDHQLPFIVAHDDEDAPLLLGMVQAHLRLGQMELLRHAAQGRLAELFGPFLADVDEGLRLLDMDRAVPEMERRLPPETREWVVRFVEGINVYKAKSRRLAPEAAMYGVEDKPWSVADVLAVGRLAAADVNWLYFMSLLPLREEPGFLDLWRRLLQAGPAGMQGLNTGLGRIPGFSARTGSNAFAVSGRLSASGAPVLACDTHVGLTLPNLWLAAAVESPSFHAAGLCLPGLPVILVGRNDHGAWGGSNMLALSSALYDVSGVPESISLRNETIQVRWWRDRKVSLPQSPYGPVVSEAPSLRDKQLGRLALKWRGHEPSDELSAFLALNRAKDWKEFRAALQGYAVSGQNLLYAGTDGDIGRVMAWERVPAAGSAALEMVADPSEAAGWAVRERAEELLAIHNPSSEMMVTANDVPVSFDPPASLFGYPEDRLERIKELILASEPLTAAKAEAIQQDALQPSALRLAKAFAVRAGALPDELAPAAQGMVRELENWDGRYAVNSTGAAALEQTAYHLIVTGYTKRYGDKLAAYLLSCPAVYELLAEDVGTFDPAVCNKAFVLASEDNMKYKTWGEMHELALSHPLGRAPIIGSRYQFGRLPWPGGMNTVQKSAHTISPGEHEVRYGANARMVADLGEPVLRVCLLGGQDGFLGSPNFMDQLELWSAGRYLDLPLQSTKARELFRHVVALTPAP
ncbi:MAG: penicillin acylase family protein [Desulfovibrionaceae bacterium]